MSIEELSMTYNSEKEELIISEYGRNVQDLVSYGKQIENDEERQKFIERIIRLMMQMHPQSGNLDDYKEKLWKHVFRIAQFDLNVQPPEGIDVSPENVMKRPEQLPYPEFGARFRHYGHHIQEMINQAIEMEEGSKRKGYISAIASYMKLAYRTWNKEHFVSDEVIKSDLETMSKGQLVLEENESISNLQHGNYSYSNNNNRRRNNKRGDNSRNQRNGRQRKNNYRGKR